MDRFRACMDYAAHPLHQVQIHAFLEMLGNVEAVPDARRLVDMLIADAAGAHNAGSVRRG